MSTVRILYVEDELFLGRIVKESLETRGFEVHMESDGAKVLTLFKKVEPDICVLDIMLPHTDGFQLAEDIRHINPSVPIIFLTAKTQAEDAVKGFRLGADDYIRKPFSLEELVVRIQHALQFRQGVKTTDPQETVRLGKLEFMPNRQVLVSSGTERKLSYRESQLLAFLSLNRDRVIERREILQLLWGNDSFFNSRNLDVYVTRIRAFLKEDPTIEIITVKGVGYRFVAD